MKKVICLLVVVGLILGSVGVASASDSPRVTTTTTRYREPGVALLWSLLLVGGGQIYNGQIGKGLLMMVGEVFAASMMYRVETVYDPYWGYRSEIKTNNIAIVATIVIPIWSMVDAYSTAKQINKEYGFTLEFDPRKDYIGFRYAFKF